MKRWLRRTDARLRRLDCRVFNHRAMATTLTWMEGRPLESGGAEWSRHSKPGPRVCRSCSTLLQDFRVTANQGMWKGDRVYIADISVLQSSDSTV